MVQARRPFLEEEEEEAPEVEGFPVMLPAKANIPPQRSGYGRLGKIEALRCRSLMLACLQLPCVGGFALFAALNLQYNKVSAF